MGKLIKNEDGTHTFKGGFSTTNQEDVEQLKSLFVTELGDGAEELKKVPEKEVKEALEPKIEELPPPVEEEPKKEIIPELPALPVKTKEAPKEEKPKKKKSSKKAKKSKKVK